MRVLALSLAFVLTQRLHQPVDFINHRVKNLTTFLAPKKQKQKVPPMETSERLSSPIHLILYFLGRGRAHWQPSIRPASGEMSNVCHHFHFHLGKPLPDCFSRPIAAPQWSQRRCYHDHHLINERPKEGGRMKAHTQGTRVFAAILFEEATRPQRETTSEWRSISLKFDLNFSAGPGQSCWGDGGRQLDAITNRRDDGHQRDCEKFN